MSTTKNLKRFNPGQPVFFRAQNALCSKTGGSIIGLRVSEQDGMVLSLERVNPPMIPELMQESKDVREKNVEPEIQREVKVTNNGWCVLDHDL